MSELPKQHIVFSIPGKDGEIHHHLVYEKYPQGRVTFPVGWSHTKALTYNPQMFDVYMSDRSSKRMALPEMQLLFLKFGVSQHRCMGVHEVPNPKLYPYCVSLTTR